MFHSILKIIAFFISSLYFLPSNGLIAQADANDFYSVQNQGSIGEVGSLYIVPPGFYFHPLHNDFAGLTDKHLTHSLRLGYWWQLDDGDAVDITGRWRFITPAYKKVKGLAIPVALTGDYADWMEVSIARSVNFHEHLKFEVQGGLGHLGNKGAKELQVNLHKAIDNSWEHLQWNEKNRGFAASSSVKLAVYSDKMLWSYFWFTHQAAFGFQDNLLMNSVFLDYNGIVEYSNQFKLAVELRAVNQVDSIYYRRLKKYRFEGSVGLLLSRYYKPTINYISPFLQDDAEPQMYIDFINFNYPL